MKTILTLRVDEVVRDHIGMCMKAQGKTMQAVLGEIVLTWAARDCPNVDFPGGHPKSKEWTTEGGPEKGVEAGKCKPVGEESIFPEAKR